MLDGRHTRPAREALKRYHYRQQDTDQAEQRLHELKKSCRKLAEQPETIYVRDTALDIIWALRESLSWQVAVACFTLPPS